MEEHLDGELCGAGGVLMAKINFQMAAKYYFEDLATDTPNKLKAAVKGGADLLATFTGQEGRYMGVIDTGDTLGAIEVTDPFNGSDGYSCSVTYKGNHSGTQKKARRNAEVAFVTEYGARGRPARPFNRRAIELHRDSVVDRMAEIIGADYARKG